MNTITVKNLSTFTDSAVLSRVAQLIEGDKYYATHDGSGKLVVNIKRKDNVYTVTDIG